MRKSTTVTEKRQARVTAPTRWWLLLAALPLSTGAALLVYVFTRISLGLALLGAALLIIAVGSFAWARLSPLARTELVRRIKIGLVAGIFATLAYDGSRWVIVTVFHDTFAPFDAFPLFGYAIAGANLPHTAATIIGTIYHYTNGIFFAIAYAILLAPRSWWIGILWALGLEALMLTVYPGWLHPKAFGEFVSVSMLGHVAYGTVLGTFSHWRYVHQRHTEALRASHQDQPSEKLLGS